MYELFGKAGRFGRCLPITVSRKEIENALFMYVYILIQSTYYILYILKYDCIQHSSKALYNIRAHEFIHSRFQMFFRIHLPSQLH